MSIVNLQEDFDWFAMDANGAVALFATSGQGFVPPTVVEFHVMHETVAGSIEYPNWGTDKIWDDAANLGLYVFDWSLPDAAYQRAASPKTVSDDTLPSMIKRITHLPILKTSFADHAQITELEQFEPPP